MLSAYFTGFWLGLSLISAIGAQNTFVLKQGLKGEHVFLVVASCVVSDTILIALGVAGFTQLLTHYPEIDIMARYFGALFLVGYSLRCFYLAFVGSYEISATKSASSWQTTLFTVLAFTWFNPHVYLDTVVLLGTLSLQFETHQWFFAFGAMCASLLLFVSLGYGAKVLQPWFVNPKAWQILDVFVGCIMLFIAASLVL